jgi:hypothetical protein
MTVLLQDVQTAKYLATDGCWVAAAADARNFHASVLACDAGRTSVSGPFRVVFHFADVKYSINVMNGVGTAAPAAARQNGHLPAQA